MYILFDHQIFSYQKYGGISKYFAELYKYLNHGNTKIHLGLRKHVNGYLAELPADTHGDIIYYPTNKLIAKFLIYRDNKKHCVDLLRKKSYDIIHSTFYDPYMLGYNTRPHVITVHDMTPELYPQYYRGTLYSHLISKKWIKGKKQLIDQADKIIAISENTKHDLMRIYNIPEHRITVIYHGCNMLPESAPRLLEDPYILFVGLRDKYKGFKTFVDGVEPVLKQNKLKALCIGGGAFSPEEQRLLKERKLDNYFMQMSVSDTGLASAYKNALCFVFPSEYEGFGMPILEAFSQNCPVILSNSSCFPEIGGNAALYFPDGNCKELTTQLTRLLSEQGLRNELTAAGQQKINKFSWSDCAAKTLQLYKSML
jgi:glycosyltransferase involved in cell wall biosynthesis